MESSSGRYANRFSGSVGEWFLARQTAVLFSLLGGLPPGSRILDVGGGHGQVTPHLTAAGFRVVVFGSPEAGRGRLATRGPGLAVGDLIRLPFGDSAFDAVVCFRILPHHSRWPDLIAEMCRVASRCVVVDYPSSRSLNAASGLLFSWKKSLEGDTRPFRLFSPGQVEEAFERVGFVVRVRRGQFFLPMVFYRVLGSAAVGKVIEVPFRSLGLTRCFGSPLVARADRRSLRGGGR